MKREDYYRSNHKSNYEPNESREAYHHDENRNPNPHPEYNNYNNYGGTQPQQPYYPPQRHHHVFLWIVVIILCLGLGWFAADHFMGGDSSQANNPSTTVNRSTTVNKTTNNKPQPTQQQPNVSKLQREMNRLSVEPKDQTTAINFYEKQNPKNQEKMNKMIDMVNKVVPSDTLKKQALNWILHD